MVNSFMKLEDFIEPWRTQAEVYAEAFGFTLPERGSNPPSSPIELAAARVFQAAFSPQPGGSEQRQQLLADMDFLLDLIAPRVAQGQPARALIPSEFWGTFAGRAIVLLTDRLLGAQFVNLQAAAAALGLGENDFYQKVVARKFSCYEDFRERSAGKRRRFDLTRLTQEYAAIKGEPPEP
jgi:hypothetical protein